MVWQVLQIFDIFQLLLLPQLVLILVGQEVALQPGSHLWEHEDHLFELLLVEVSEHSINLGANAGAPRLLEKKSDLSKEGAGAQCPHLHVSLLNWIFDEDLAFSILNEEEAVVELALVDQRELWIKQKKLQRFDEEVDESVVLLEQGTVHGLLLEDELDDFVLQRRRQTLVEVLKLLLTILRLLSVLQVTNDILLQVLGHIHVLHRRVRQVNRLLKLRILEVEILYDQCHVAEDDRVDDGP